MQKNILITGAAKRIGAVCAKHFHHLGCNILLHYRFSESEALALCTELNQLRPGSAQAIQADLLDQRQIADLAKQASRAWGGLDVLVNNASSFYPVPFPEVNESAWDDLLGSNLKAPFFLTQALAPVLQQRSGCVVNVIDIHAERGLPGYSVYCIAKAGLAAMTRILAKELAPSIRVNGVAPGAIIWPEQDISGVVKSEILERVALKRSGEPEDIAKAVGFLIEDAPYITGQVITVDGGRTLFY